MQNNIIPQDIIKIQKKLASFEKDSRNYKKYTRILAKHIKSYTMKQRVTSHIKSIETIEKIENKGVEDFIKWKVLQFVIKIKSLKKNC